VRITVFTAVLVLGAASCKGCDEPPATKTQASASASVSAYVPPTEPPAPSLKIANRLQTDARIKRCLIDQRAQYPFAGGTLRIEITLAPDGKVTAVKDTAHDGIPEPVSKCVQDIVKGEVFDPPGKQAVVNIPLHFD
jgi:hypothetical protein